MQIKKLITRLNDFYEIENLVKKYCFYFDLNDPKNLIELFSKDAHVDYGPEISALNGKEEILEMVSKGLSKTFDATSHHISNFLINFCDNDLAASNCYIYAWHKYKERKEVGYLWGRYEHEYVRIDGVWKINKMKLYGVATQDFHRATMHSINRY